MKFHLVTVAAIVLALTSQIANANWYRRINRQMMHHQGSHPFADRFWNVIDNEFLQDNGLFDQLVQEVLRRNNIANSNQTAADGSMVAQRSVVQDQNLVNADAKVRKMAQKLGVTYVEFTEAPSSNSPQNVPIAGGVDTPVTVPQGYQAPATGPSQAPR